MSTDPRTGGQIDESSVNPADVELVAKAFVAEAKKNPVDTSHYSWGVTSQLLTGPNEFDIARAILAALDLDARDARVRAEAAAAIRAEANRLETQLGAGYSYAYGFADAADFIDPASPSSSPVDAPSRPTGTPGPCSCPDCDVSTMADRDAGRWPTVKGLDPSCPIHGAADTCATKETT